MRKIAIKIRYILIYVVLSIIIIGALGVYMSMHTPDKYYRITSQECKEAEETLRKVLKAFMDNDFDKFHSLVHSDSRNYFDDKKRLEFHKTIFRVDSRLSKPEKWQKTEVLSSVECIGKPNEELAHYSVHSRFEGKRVSDLKPIVVKYNLYDKEMIWFLFMENGEWKIEGSNLGLSPSYLKYEGPAHIPKDEFDDCFYDFKDLVPEE